MLDWSPCDTLLLKITEYTTYHPVQPAGTNRKRRTVQNSEQQASKHTSSGSTQDTRQTEVIELLRQEVLTVLSCRWEQENGNRP